MHRFINLGIVGEGSYGTVFKCITKTTRQPVAIKKFIDLECDELVKKIAVREVKMLKQLHHVNLINLIEVFMERKELYLVLEFVEQTLLDLLNGYTNGLDSQLCRINLWQVLNGMQFIHSCNVIHRDLKPENILISNNGVVKICDFGFARQLTKPGENYTDYVATRWYRAPELLVGDIKYGRSVDIWAIGCMLAEMLTSEPLFPGDSDIDQLYLIMEYLGNLSQRHKEVFHRSPLFVGMKMPVVHVIVPFETKFSKISVSAESLSFMKQCLQIASDKRPTCTELLKHKFFTESEFDKNFPQLFKKMLMKDKKISLFQSPQSDINESNRPSNSRSERRRIQKMDEAERKDYIHRLRHLQDKSRNEGTESWNSNSQAKCYPSKFIDINSQDNTSNNDTVEVCHANDQLYVSNSVCSNSLQPHNLAANSCWNTNKYMPEFPLSSRFRSTSIFDRQHTQNKNKTVKKVCRFSNNYLTYHHYDSSTLPLKHGLVQKSPVCGRSIIKSPNSFAAHDKLCEEQSYISLPDIKKQVCTFTNEQQTDYTRSNITIIPDASDGDHLNSSSLSDVCSITSSDKDSNN